jgi:hypothetical protein
MEPYYKEEHAYHVKSLIDFLYATPERKKMALVFNYKMLKCSSNTIYSKLQQGGKYLWQKLDPAYKDKVFNLRLDRKNVNCIKVYLRSAASERNQLIGNAMFEEFLQKGLVGTTADITKDNTKSIELDPETGEEVEIDTAIGEAAWKDKLLTFLEVAEVGQTLVIDNIKLTPPLIKLIKYYIDQVGGEDEFTIVSMDKTVVKIARGNLQEAGLLPEGEVMKPQNYELPTDIVA